jgi:phage gp29-like protein
VATSAYGAAVASIPKRADLLGRWIASQEATEWGFVSAIGEDEHPSVVVRDHSEAGDRIGEVYTRMLRTDPMLAGLAEKRTKAVVGLPWDIVPADESPEAQRVAEFVRWALYGIRNIEANLAHQLGGVFAGCAFDEMRWGVVKRGEWAGMWTVEELVDRPMHRFGFRQGALHVRTKLGGLQPVPPARILHLCHGTKDNAWGSALLDRVWWFYWLGLHAWKYYGVALEKWAQPTVAVTYPRSPDGTTVNEAVIANALAVAADVQSQYAIAYPNDLDVVLKEATRGGSVSYESFIALLDRAKALVFLGEVDTSGLAKGPGSFAKSRVSNDVRYETILADATELANCLTDGLIAPLVRVNFGLDAPMPYWEFDVEEASDREARQKGAEVIFNAGYPVPKSYYYRVHQVPQAKAGEPTMRGPWVPSTPRPPGSVAPTAAPSDEPETPWDEQDVA